jgi:hypothetical protein
MPVAEHAVDAVPMLLLHPATSPQLFDGNTARSGRELAGELVTEVRASVAD